MADMEDDQSQQSLEAEGEDIENEDQYEDDGFIDDRSFDEYEEKTDKKKRKKRRRKREEEEEEFDEEDLALVNENKQGSGKRKRIKKNREKLKEEEASQRYDDEVSERDEQHREPTEEELHKQKQISVFKDIFDSSDDEDEKIEMKDEEEKELTIRDNSAMSRFRDSSWRKEIIEINIPERIYIRLKDRLKPSDQELELEAAWIYKYKKHWKGNSVGEERMVLKINEVLSHFRKNHFDIPFIATYRYYLFQHELQRSDFYDIYEMDLEWDNFIKTKKSLIKKVKQVIDKIPGKQELEICVENCMTTYDLHDVNLYLTF